MILISLSLFGTPVNQYKSIKYALISEENWYKFMKINSFCKYVLTAVFVFFCFGRYKKPNEIKGGE